MFGNILSKMQTPMGKIIISLILGIGLASLFRKSCDREGNCLVFKAPPLDDIIKNTYKHNNECYNFKQSSITCGNLNKKSVIFA
jgi:hypothetical protein